MAIEEEAQLSTHGVAQFVANSDWQALPPAVRDRATVHLLDTIGVLVAGSQAPASAIARSMILGDEMGYSALGRSGQAFADAMSASALDFDDGHVGGGGIHPSAVIIPTLLASSRGRDVRGADLLAAYVAGYEVAVRVGRLLYPRASTDRYHCAGTAACVGAAAAGARVQTRDAETIERAIEVAFAHAPMAAFQLPMVKESMGWSASTATFAVELALAGFKRVGEGRSLSVGPIAFGLPTPFDDAEGDAADFASGLGARFEILHGYIKPFACCRYIHSAVECLLHLVQQRHIMPDDIETIKVRTHRGASQLDDRRPASIDHAQYSIPFVLGSVVARGVDGAIDLVASRLDDAEILRFADRVEVIHFGEFDTYVPDSYPAELEIVTADGGTSVASRIDSLGDDGRPLTRAQVEAKFDRNVSSVTSAEHAAELRDACASLSSDSALSLVSLVDLTTTHATSADGDDGGARGRQSERPRVDI